MWFYYSSFLWWLVPLGLLCSIQTSAPKSASFHAPSFWYMVNSIPSFRSSKDWISITVFPFTKLSIFWFKRCWIPKTSSWYTCQSKVLGGKTSAWKFIYRYCKLSWLKTTLFISVVYHLDSPLGQLCVSVSVCLVWCNRITKEWNEQCNGMSE